MTTYTRSSPSFSRFILVLLVLLALAVAVLWYIGHRSREEMAGDNLFPATASHASTSTSADLAKAGDAASSALSKAGVAASAAVSETSADIKAAVDKQKQQDASQSSGRSDGAL